MTICYACNEGEDSGLCKCTPMTKMGAAIKNNDISEAIKQVDILKASIEEKIKVRQEIIRTMEDKDKKPKNVYDLKN